MKIIRIVWHFFFWNWFPWVQDLYNTFTSYIRVRELRGPIRGMTYEDIKKLFCLYILSWKNLSTKPTQRLGKWNSVTKFFFCFHIDVSQLVIDLKQQQLKTITIFIVKYMKLGCADLPFPLWTCSLCVHCKTKTNKKISWILFKKFRAFSKFSTKNFDRGKFLKIRSSINLPWGHAGSQKNLGQNCSAVLTFIR